MASIFYNLNVPAKLSVNINVKTLKISIEKIPPQTLVTWDSVSARRSGRAGKRSSLAMIFFIVVYRMDFISISLLKRSS